MAGFLHKEGHLVRNWKKRWFVLQEEGDKRLLRYFDGDGEDGRMKGEVLLTRGTVVELLEVGAARPFTFALVGPDGRRVLKMQASSEAEMRAWGCALDERFLEQELLARHDEAVRCLSEPAEFLKHGRMGQPHMRVVFLSPDQSSLCWRKAAGADLQGSMLDADGVNVVSGMTPAVFQRSGKPGTEHCCFSVTGDERTLDLQCTTTEERDFWVLHLRNILRWQAHRRLKRERRAAARQQQQQQQQQQQVRSPRSTALMEKVRQVEARRR